MKTVLLILICVTVLANEVRGHRLRRFVGGNDASEAQFPYQVSLRQVEPDMHFCGGSIIHEKIILTAAHCLRTYDLSPKDFFVVAGSIFVYSSTGHYTVDMFAIHENYDNDTVINDIALIRLEEPLKFSKNIQKISLPAFMSDPPAGASMTVSGFGDIQFKVHNRATLQYSIVTSNSLTDCRKVISQVRYSITNEHMCTLDQSKGVCSGDSGGPLVYNGEQVGIVTWGLGTCAEGYPEVYVKVASYVKWIEKTMDELIRKNKTTKLLAYTMKVASTTELTEPIPELFEITTEFDKYLGWLYGTTPMKEIAESIPELAEASTELDEYSGKINETRKKITEPLTDLAESTRELDEYSTKLTDNTKEIVESITELAEASIELDEYSSKSNETRTKITEPITDLAESTRELDEYSTKLTDNMKEIVESITELAEASIELDESSNKLTETTTEIPESITDLAESTRELDEYSTKLTDNTTQIAESITELAAASTELDESSNKLNETRTEITESITDLAKSKS